MYDDRYEMGERDNWKFEYRGSELVEPATKRHDYHKRRYDVWKAEKDKTEKEVRSSGVQLAEHFVTGGSRFEAKIDSSLGKRLAECHDKMNKHRDLVEEYQGFIHEFQRSPERTFVLRLADLRYFGLVGEAVQFGDESLS